MERIRAEDECQSLVYKKKLMEYQKLKDILRTLIDSDLFKLVEESLGVSVVAFIKICFPIPKTASPA